MVTETIHTTRRLPVLDWLRGLTLLSMVVYHTMWDLVYMFDVTIPWYRTRVGFFWQQSICWTFILLSGFCFRLGKKPLQRGLVVLGASLLVSLVSIVVTPENAVRLGVLTLIGSCMILLIPINRLLQKVEPWFGLILSFLLFGITRYAAWGNLGFFSARFLELPAGLYRNLLTAWLGFPSADFQSSDYFPMIPWLFLYLCGYFLHSIFLQRDRMAVLRCASIPPLEWIGRHSLLLYLIHQPVIYGILTLLLG